MQEKEERHTERLKAAVKTLMKSPDGRYFLKWLIEPTLLYKPDFPKGHAEAAYREGSRAIGWSLFVLASGDIDKILKEE